jgi:hypothetical protein
VSKRGDGERDEEEGSPEAEASDRRRDSEDEQSAERAWVIKERLGRPVQDLTAGELVELIESSVAGVLAAFGRGGQAGAHVNSGPPGHTNVPGHANFDPKTRFGGPELSALGGWRGVHVNSGPPGHANEGGHANFDPVSRVGGLQGSFGGWRAEPHANSGPPGHANEPGHANFEGAHVNSGPPGHANEPGHANFDPDKLGARRGWEGAHVNSGPPGHANEPGHANFDPETRLGTRGDVMRVTLPDGTVATIPPGPFDVNIRGFRVQR